MLQLGAVVFSEASKLLRVCAEKPHEGRQVFCFGKWSPAFATVFPVTNCLNPGIWRSNTMYDFIPSQSVLDEYGHLVNRDFLWQNSDVVLPIAVFC